MTTCVGGESRYPKCLSLSSGLSGCFNVAADIFESNRSSSVHIYSFTDDVFRIYSEQTQKPMCVSVSTASSCTRQSCSPHVAVLKSRVSFLLWSTPRTCA